METSDTLIVITARGGSKGIPKKNIRPLAGKPLICYSIDIARQLTDDSNICVTTDSSEIADVVEAYGLKVPFMRPPELATDTAGSYEVLIHCLNHYESIGKKYNKLVLLQPTSPFRTIAQTTHAISLYNDKIDMVVSVKESEANPYYNLFEINKEGFLEKCKEGNFVRRQDCPPAYQYNGALYVINTASLRKGPLHQFKKVAFFVMDEVTSTDLDNQLDWAWAEFLIDNKLVRLQ